MDVFSAKWHAGEAAHMAKKHSQLSRLRYLYAGTHCPACLREFHLPYRVLQHLRTAEACRRALRNRGLLDDPAVGMGSTTHREYEKVHNRLLPWQQTQGPLADAGPHDDFNLAVASLEVLDQPISQDPDEIFSTLRNRHCAGLRDSSQRSLMTPWNTWNFPVTCVT